MFRLLVVSCFSPTNKLLCWQHFRLSLAAIFPGKHHSCAVHCKFCDRVQWYSMWRVECCRWTTKRGTRWEDSCLPRPGLVKNELWLHIWPILNVHFESYISDMCCQEHSWLDQLQEWTWDDQHFGCRLLSSALATEIGLSSIYSEDKDTKLGQIFQNILFSLTDSQECTFSLLLQSHLPSTSLWFKLMWLFVSHLFSENIPWLSFGWWGAVLVSILRNI